jgi:hypothetical protein
MALEELRADIHPVPEAEAGLALTLSPTYRAPLAGRQAARGGTRPRSSFPERAGGNAGGLLLDVPHPAARLLPLRASSSPRLCHLELQLSCVRTALPTGWCSPARR